MKRILMLGGLFALLSSCNACRNLHSGTPDPTLSPYDVTLTIMSYNVGVFKKYYDDLGHYSYPEVAAIINSVGPDVIGLNETDWERPRTEGQHQAELLAKQLGDEWKYQFTYALDATYGNSILWKDNFNFIRGLPRLELPKDTGSEVRSMGAVQFHDYIFCVTHLDHRSEADRLNAVRLITQWAKGHNSGPIFLVGDMNATSDSETIQELKKDWTPLSVTDNTHSTANPSKCIDYIFFFTNSNTVQKIEVLDGGVVTTAKCPDAAKASDHLAIWTKVHFIVQPPYR